MGIRRVQKVVLREKVLRERLKKLKGAFFKVLKITAFFLLVGGSMISIYRLLYISDFFMIKSLTIEPSATKVSERIESSVSYIKGKPIFKISTRKLEEKLRVKFPELQTVDIYRELPDGIRVRYEKRVPAASLSFIGEKVAKPGLNPADPNFRMKVVDANGIIFFSEDSPSFLPEVVVNSTGSLHSAISFLRVWSATGAIDSSHLSTGSARRIFVDESGEVSLYMNDGTRIVWGQNDAGTFNEKFERLQMVWSDLRIKSLRAEYINLRNVPQNGQGVLTGNEIVGRVVVRPLIQDKNEKKIPEKKSSSSGENGHPSAVRRSYLISGQEKETR